jgi:hypothetical protein
MGMGYGSNFADVIEFEDVEKLCPDEVGSLTKALEKYGVAMETLAQAFRWEEPELDDLQTAVGEGAPETLDEKDWDAYEEQGVQEIAEAFENLKAAFAQATRVGESNLTLSIGYHNAEDDGDRYDDVDGVFWAVGGLYQLTPSGKKIGDKVERKFFVTLG